MMRFKARRVVVMLAVAGALSALVTASASAQWFVGGTALAGSAALLPQALVDASSTLLVPVLGLSIVCSGHFLDAVSPLIIAPDKIYAASLTFLGCNTTVPAKGCALEEENQPIPLAASLARVFLSVGEEDRLLFAPETKGVFTELKFREGDTCAFAGEEPVKGSFIAGAPTGRLELATQSLVALGSVENNSLQIGGEKVFFDSGRSLLRLVSDSKWSFM